MQLMAQINADGSDLGPRSEAEANAYLAMVMILTALLLMVLVRRFGLVLLELESGKVSQGAMLKQVSTPPTQPKIRDCTRTGLCGSLACLGFRRRAGWIAESSRVVSAGSDTSSVQSLWHKRVFPPAWRAVHSSSGVLSPTVQM